jgi:hypothetical protein
VFPACTALGDDQVVVVSVMIEVWPFGSAPHAAAENATRLTDETSPFRAVLLKDDTAERVSPRTMVPNHVYNPLSALIISEKGWIKAATVQINRI